MLYRTMPKNGDKLSILGFGCMRLPTSEGKIDEKRAIAQIKYSICSSEIITLRQLQKTNHWEVISGLPFSGIGIR
jgi:hypothetical protein